MPATAHDRCGHEQPDARRLGHVSNSRAIQQQLQKPRLTIVRCIYDKNADGTGWLDHPDVSRLDRNRRTGKALTMRESYNEFFHRLRHASTRVALATGTARHDPTCTGGPRCRADYAAMLHESPTHAAARLHAEQQRLLAAKGISVLAAAPVLRTSTSISYIKEPI